MDETQRLKLLQKIIESHDSEIGGNLLLSGSTDKGQIQQGQFVYALHPFTSVMNCIGYALQVRKGAAAFGSNLTLIRLANGSIHQWNNQSFFAMSEEQEALARQAFPYSPEEEDYSRGYSCCNKTHELGFLIENSQPSPATDSPSVSITVTNGKSAEFISFI